RRCAEGERAEFESTHLSRQVSNIAPSPAFRSLPFHLIQVHLLKLPSRFETPCRALRKCSHFRFSSWLTSCPAYARERRVEPRIVRSGNVISQSACFASRFCRRRPADRVVR